jgi:hypothetical protein
MGLVERGRRIMSDGRDVRGRFARGNQGGPGNPWAAKTLHFKTLIQNAVTDADMLAVIKALVDAAKGGDIKAAAILIDRLVGKPGYESDSMPVERVTTFNGSPALTKEEAEEVLREYGYVKAERQAG